MSKAIGIEYLRVLQGDVAAPGAATDQKGHLAGHVLAKVKDKRARAGLCDGDGREALVRGDEHVMGVQARTQCGRACRRRRRRHPWQNDNY